MSAVRKKRRRYKRRGRFGFLYKMLAAIALTGAVFMGATVFFRVERVEVAGNVRYTAEQVEQACGAQHGDNLFGLNKYDMAAKIRRNLPYVESVNIRRKLPDTLKITVDECRAAARMSGDSWLISASGKLLEWVESAPEVLTVYGVDPVLPEPGTAMTVRPEQQLRADALTALLQALERADMLDRVEELDLTKSAYILMELDGRFTVKLPVGGDYDYLLGAMGKAIGTLEPYEKGTLDLTVKDYTVIFSPA